MDQPGLMLSYTRRMGTGNGMVRWVAFDAVGTLIFPEPAAGEVYHAVARRHGSRIELVEVSRRFREAFAALEAAGDHRTSEAVERRRWREIVGRVIEDVPDSDACFEELFAHFARPGSWRCFPEVGEALEALSRRGVRVAIASNFDARLHSLCDGLSELKGVATRVVSSEAGHRKPSRGFFETLLSATGARADEILMVGDDLDNDVRGAIAAGLRAAWLRRGASVESEAESEGIAAINDLTDVLWLL